LNHSHRFSLYVAITFVVTLGVYAGLASPSGGDLLVLALVLLAFSLLALVVGHMAYAFSWFRRSPRILWTLLASYAFVGVLVLLGVVTAALLMFISADDVRLVGALLLFGVGIMISFGYLVAAGVASDAKRLVVAADHVAKGQLDVRVEPRGRDEIAALAGAFNEMTEALAVATEKQRQAEMMRLDLIAWAGHDLRTPLTSVTVLVEALADGLAKDTETVDRYLQTAKRDLHVLSLLIDDLSLLAQIDAGGLHLTKRVESLSGLLNEAAESFSLQAEHKEVRLLKDIDEGPMELSFDRLQMRRAMTNLLDNAMRHAPRGGTVRVRGRTVAEGASIEVWNDGPPIHPDDLPHLFERFYRSDKSRSRATGRAGLGLAIARAIVEAHDGTIDVDSAVDRGTRFMILLPGLRTANITPVHEPR
jgi:signal transduction histidine kinase